MKIGKLLKEVRTKECSYTQKYVAKQLGISIKAYANIENDISDITLTRLSKIADIFNCNLISLLSNKYMPNKTRNEEAVDKLQQLMIDTLQKRVEIYEDLLQRHGIHVQNDNTLMRHNYFTIK